MLYPAAVIPAHELARSALAGVLRRAPLSPEKVALAWQMSVGSAIAQAVTAVALDEGVLRVTARDAQWRNEIERSAGLVRRRLNGVLGDNVVHELRVTLP
jgi:predicted nucleic acid-binding Zn ribbon protein